MLYTMSDDQERIERESRAERLRWAREQAKIGGQKKVATALGINEGTYKAHEQGRNGFGMAHARTYARAFKVSLAWLYFGTGKPEDGPTADPRLAEIFERLQKAPEDVQTRLIKYADYELKEIGL